jgi:hypothetical protein
MQGKRVSILFIYISEFDTKNISKGLVIEIKNIFRHKNVNKNEELTD